MLIIICLGPDAPGLNKFRVDAKQFMVKQASG